MLDHVVGVGLARARAQAPGLAAAQVLHEIGFAVGVGHRVVRPGGELVQSAVAGPTTADTALRDMGTEIGIGQHVDPRPSRPLGGVDGEAVGAAVGVEAAARRASGRSPVGQAGRGGGPGQAILLRVSVPVQQLLHMVRQWPAVGIQAQPRESGQAGLLWQRQLIGGQQVEAGAAPRQLGRGPGPIAVAQRLQFLANPHQVGRRFGVEHHQVAVQPAPAPPLRRLDQ